MIYILPFILMTFSYTKNHEGEYLEKIVEAKVSEIAVNGDVLVVEFSNHLLQNRYYLCTKESVYAYAISQKDENLNLTEVQGYSHPTDSLIVKYAKTKSDDFGGLVSKNNTSCNDCYSLYIEQWRKNPFRTKRMSRSWKGVVLNFNR